MKHIKRIFAFTICLCLFCTSALAGLPSLKELVEQANAGDTVDAAGVDNTITEDTQVTINKNLTIDLGSNTITQQQGTSSYAAIIVTNGATVTIKNGSIVGSGVKDVYSNTIEVTNGALTLDYVDVTNGYTGIEVSGTGSSLTVTNNSSVSNNGYGIYVGNGGTVTVTNSTVSNNEGTGIYAGQYAGGNATVTINNSSITGNAYGGIDVYSGTLDINDDSVIASNTTELNGAGIRAEESTVTIDGATIKDNVSEPDGGGIFVYNSEVTINNTKITGNKTTMGVGGGMGINGSEVTIGEDTTISGNSAPMAGGIYGTNDAKLTLKGGKIDGNTATVVGDDVVLVMCEATLSGTEIGEAANVIFDYGEYGTFCGGFNIVDGADLPDEITVVKMDGTIKSTDFEDMITEVTEGVFALSYSGSDPSEFTIANYEDSYLYMVVIENDQVKLVLNPNPVKPTKKSKTVYYNEGDTLNIKGCGWIITSLSFNEETGRFEWYLVNQQELTNEEMADPEGTLEKMLGDKKGDITAITADQKVLDKYFGGRQNHIMIYCTSEILH